MSEQFIEDGGLSYEDPSYEEGPSEFVLTEEQLREYVDSEVAARVQAALPPDDLVTNEVLAAQQQMEQSGSLVPRDAQDFQVARGIIDSANALVANSPGARQFHEEMQTRGNQLVMAEIDRNAAELGGTVVDRPSAIRRAEEYFAAGVRSGMSNEEAQKYATKEAARASSGKDTYKSVGDRFAVKTHNQRLDWDRRR